MFNSRVIVFRRKFQKSLSLSLRVYSKHSAIDIYSRNMASNLPQLKVTEDLESSEYDALVVVAPSIKSIPFEKVADPLKAYIEVDKTGETGIFVVPSNLPSKFRTAWAAS